MNNEELVKELLTEKDPETLLRKVHGLSPKTISDLFSASENDELLEYIARTMQDNPEIRKKIQNG